MVIRIILAIVFLLSVYTMTILLMRLAVRGTDSTQR